MAKILYWIGKDVEMKYKPGGSGTSSINAYNLLQSLDFTIPSGFADFDIEDITRYIQDNHIIYLRGSGHAWVSDACRFCVDPDDPTKITETQIRCDWGWGGTGNGYYSARPFEVETIGMEFTPTEYFAIKRDVNPTNIERP